MQQGELTPETAITEAARQVLAGQWAIVQQHQSAVIEQADVTAVHETRKAIRRTFTAMKLFAPFFEPDVLASYRRPLKKVMRHLGRSRDTAVFRQKLHQFCEAEAVSLPCLVDYWRGVQTAVDTQLQAYLIRPKRQVFWRDYHHFLTTPGLGVTVGPSLAVPTGIGAYIPILIGQRLAAVQAYDSILAEAGVGELHQLRIQGKELRYTLQFFTPLLGEAVAQALEHLKAMQEHLGELNDAVVALALLTKTSGCETAVAAYSAVKQRQIEQLVAEFLPIWTQFNTPEWQQNLVSAMAVLEE